MAPLVGVEIPATSCCHTSQGTFAGAGAYVASVASCYCIKLGMGGLGVASRRDADVLVGGRCRRWACGIDW